MKFRSHIILATLIAACFVSSANAQSGISDEKRKLIAEMVTVFKMESQMAQITDSILQEMEKTFPIGYAAAIDARNDLTPVEKAKIKTASAEVFVSVSQKFRARLAATIDFKKYIEESVYPLYDRLYTEQELKDLITFYRTPTGQKVIETLPRLVAESQETAREKLLPQIIPVIQQVMAEEMERVGPPPPRKRTN
jgi:hypothetical protein